MRMTIPVLILIIAATLSTTVLGAEFETRTYAVGVDIEGQYIPSAVYLRMQVKDYGQPFDDFAKGQLDPYERAFALFVDAIRGNDAVTAAQLLGPETRKTATAPVPETHSPAEVVTVYRKVFGGMKDITVVSQVLVGSRRLFIWQSNAGMTGIRRAFAVEGEGDAMRVQQVTSNDPIAAMVVNNVMTPMLKSPQAYKTAAAKPAGFVYPLPVGGKAPVAMQFGGTSTEMAASSGKPGVAAEIQNLYRETAEALRLRAIDRFLANFTPRSATKMKEYIDEVPETAYGQINDLAWGKKQVRFVVGSDPVYIVYYTVGDDSSEYKYDYVVRDAETSKLKIANVLRRSTLDEVLANPELFDPALLVAPKKSVSE